MDKRIELESLSQDELINLASKLQAEIASLRYQLNMHLRHRFGRKAEKCPPEQLELPFFDEAFEPSEAEKKQIEVTDEQVAVAAYTRNKTGRKSLPKDLPRVEKIYDLADSDKVCSCGCSLTKIGEQISEQLDIIPAKVQVIEHKRYKYACKACEEKVVTAPVAKHPIPKSMASPGLLAYIATSKYVEHCPLYRQEQMFQRLGVELRRNTLSLWIIKISELLRPLYQLLLNSIRNNDITFSDETRIQVLREGSRPAETKSYMWVVIGGTSKQQSVIFHYNESRSHNVLTTLLTENYSGYLHCDGYIAYETFAHKAAGATLVGCWMHCRRKFYEITQSCKSEGLAFIAVKMIKKLFDIERKCKNKPPDFIFDYRKKYAQPILLEFKSWLDEHVNKVLPKSPIGEAINYALNQWSKLIAYVNDGRLKIDNGISERAIKPFVIGRKNWLFSNSVAGARAGEVLYSLIESAKLNKIEPYAYLRTVLEKMPYTETESDMHKLLPFNLDIN